MISLIFDLCFLHNWYLIWTVTLIYASNGLNDIVSHFFFRLLITIIFQLYWLSVPITLISCVSRRWRLHPLSIFKWNLAILSYSQISNSSNLIGPCIHICINLLRSSWFIWFIYLSSSSRIGSKLVFDANFSNWVSYSMNGLSLSLYACRSIM